MHVGPVRGIDFHSNQPLFVSGGDDYKIKVSTEYEMVQGCVNLASKQLHSWSLLREITSKQFFMTLEINYRYIFPMIYEKTKLMKGIFMRNLKN